MKFKEKVFVLNIYLGHRVLLKPIIPIKATNRSLGKLYYGVPRQSFISNVLKFQEIDYQHGTSPKSNRTATGKETWEQNIRPGAVIHNCINNDILRNFCHHHLTGKYFFYAVIFLDISLFQKIFPPVVHMKITYKWQ